MLNLQINGLYPVIINISPVTNLPFLLGLADEDAPRPAKHSPSHGYSQSARGILRGKENIV